MRIRRFAVEQVRDDPRAADPEDFLRDLPADRERVGQRQFRLPRASLNRSWPSGPASMMKARSALEISRRRPARAPVPLQHAADQRAEAFEQHGDLPQVVRAPVVDRPGGSGRLRRTEDQNRRRRAQADAITGRSSHSVAARR
jgi:hypothetical protein